MPPEHLPLAAVQAALFSRITGLEGGAAGDAAALVAGDTRASAEERLAIYVHMYRARLVEALESQFPRLARAVGAHEFSALGGAYVAAHPSTHPSLRELGASFPAWLATSRPDHQSLTALARLEWARDDVFDLADQPVLTIDDLRMLSPEQFGALALRLIDAHRFVELPAGTAAWWDALGPAPSETADAAEPSTPPAPPPGMDGRAVETALVWRQGVAVFHRVVDAPEVAALRAVAAGTSFGAVCDLLLAAGLADEEAAGQAFGWLSTWAVDGLLSEGSRRAGSKS